jgi:hypothetical protein
VKIETVRQHALSLDAVTEQPHHEYASFRVRGKIFVTVPPAGDVIHVFVDEEDRERALAMYPAWTEKLLWGGKVAGLRITLASAVPAAVRALVGKAYERESARADWTCMHGRPRSRPARRRRERCRAGDRCQRDAGRRATAFHRRALRGLGDRGRGLRLGVQRHDAQPGAVG